MVFICQKAHRQYPEPPIYLLGTNPTVKRSERDVEHVTSHYYQDKECVAFSRHFPIRLLSMISALTHAEWTL